MKQFLILFAAVCAMTFLAGELTPSAAEALVAASAVQFIVLFTRAVLAVALVAMASHVVVSMAVVASMVVVAASVAASLEVASAIKHPFSDSSTGLV